MDIDLPGTIGLAVFGQPLWAITTNPNPRTNTYTLEGNSLIVDPQFSVFSNRAINIIGTALIGRRDSNPS